MFAIFLDFAIENTCAVCYNVLCNLFGRARKVVSLAHFLEKRKKKMKEKLDLLLRDGAAKIEAAKNESGEQEQGTVGTSKGAFG